MLLDEENFPLYGVSSLMVTKPFFGLGAWSLLTRFTGQWSLVSDHGKLALEFDLVQKKSLKESSFLIRRTSSLCGLSCGIPALMGTKPILGLSVDKQIRPITN